MNGRTLVECLVNNTKVLLNVSDRRIQELYCEDLITCSMANTSDNSTLYLNSMLFGEEGAALYICIIIITFALAIVFTIIAQMSYQPENQVTSYLQQRSMLRERLMLEHILKRKEKRASIKLMKLPLCH